MSILETIVGISLVLILLGLAAYFTVRQKTAVKRLRTQTQFTEEDKLYVVKQTRRRLMCSFLMVVLAAMLVGWYFLRDELRPVPTANAKNDQVEVKMTDEQKSQLRWATMYWCIALMVIFAIACLALLDFMATARFSHRQFRKLDAQRQEALEDELARWRTNRNGFT